MMEWISTNKEWVFSGIGVLVITWIVGIIIFLSNKKSSNPSKVVNQKAGKNSKNIQIENMNINQEKEKK